MTLEAKREVEIVNKLGLHARPASKFVSLASNYESEVFISNGTQEVNGKSIMGVLILAASKGTKIGLRAVGIDSSDAVENLANLILSGFEEE